MREENWILFGCLIVALPACLAKNLHALRHMCYVGFFSALILTAAIGYRYNDKLNDKLKALRNASVTSAVKMMHVQ
jgi:amino acid permease